MVLRKELRTWFGWKLVWPDTPLCSGAQIVPELVPLLGQDSRHFPSVIGVSSPVQELEWWVEPPRRHSCPLAEGSSPEKGAVSPEWSTVGCAGPIQGIWTRYQ